MSQVVHPDAVHPDKGQTVGYVCVSTFEQNESRRLEGLKVDCVFMDRDSGKNIRGPKLKALMKYIRAGDMVICHSKERPGRNLVDLRKTVTENSRRKLRLSCV